MLRIFIGFDPRQTVSYTVLQNSLLYRSSAPLQITPLIIEQLPITRMGLTPFTYTRFLVPWLCDYDGKALFMDADMLVLDDIAELFKLKTDCAVDVVKAAERFEWASLMLFDCKHPDNKVLTPEYVSRADGLHKIGWTDSVGDLPAEWNHCVLYDEPKEAKLVHFTAGIPAFPETEGCEYSKEWIDELNTCRSTLAWQALMGTSVHVRKVQAFNAQKTVTRTSA